MKSNLEWKFWAEKDPLFGVASWAGKNKDGAQPWTDEDFYQLGVLDWEDFVLHWNRYGLQIGTCVEIGCGAGRLTAAMAQTFDQVIALDVAQPMLDYAREHVNLEKVRLELVDGSRIPAADQSVNAVFSTHVFQHIDSAAGVLGYFQEMARCLSPGGSMMIHLPVFTWPPGAGVMTRLVYRISKAAERVVAGIKRLLLKLGAPARLMRMNAYEVDWLYQQLSLLGFDDIELAIFATRSNRHPHAFVLARKKVVDEQS